MPENQSNTTIQVNSSHANAETIFQYIDRNIVGDLLTIDQIVEGENSAHTYCSVPQTQALFAFSDLMGYLISKPGENNAENSVTNLSLFFKKCFNRKNNIYSGSLFSSEYKRYFPLLKKMYRDGLVHQYFPKTSYYGITKFLPPSAPLFVENSLNVRKMTSDILKAYTEIKSRCLTNPKATYENKVLLENVLANWFNLQIKNDINILCHFILLMPEYWVPEIIKVVSNKPVRLLFNIYKEDEIVEFYKNKKNKYSNDDNSHKYSKADAKEKMFYDSNEEYFIDFFDVNDLVSAEIMLKDICPIGNAHFKNKISGICQWVSESNFSNYERVISDVEKYVYRKDGNVLPLVNNKIPASVKGFRGGVPNTYKNSFRKDYSSKFENLTEMFNNIDNNPDLLSELYIMNSNKLPISLCREITLSDLLKFEDKLDEVFICNSFRDGRRGREGEYNVCIYNSYGGLLKNENFELTDEICEFLKNKKIIGHIIWGSEAEDEGFDVKSKKTLDSVAKSLLEQRGIIYTGSVAPFIYPSCKVSEDYLANFKAGGFRYFNNFSLSSDYTLRHSIEFSSIKNPSIMRPFYKNLFDKKFINNLLNLLRQYEFDSEDWYNDLNRYNNG